MCFLGAILFLASCKKEVAPKPFAQLRLNYPEATYKNVKNNFNYSFKASTISHSNWYRKDGLQISYPTLKAKLILRYLPLSNNINTVLLKAEQMVNNHKKKAMNIVGKTYENEDARVYGKLYEFVGNTAVQFQFYLTDSTKNFVNGTLYFDVKPNYDSLRPTIAYLKKDIIHLMETLNWKK